MSLLLVEAAGWRPIGAHLRVDFRHLPADCTVAIVGDNGAGKSTLLRLIGYSEHGDALVGRGWAADMRHPRSPEATVVVWRSLPDGRLLKIRRRVSKRDTHVFIDIFPAGSELVEQGGWFDATGTPETLCGGLVSTAPAVLTALGTIPTALYMAAGAADQAGAGSFFSLAKVDDRRAVIGAACDIERLAPLAKIGETYRLPLKRVVEHLAARVEALAARSAELSALDVAIVEAERRLAVALETEARETAALEVATRDLEASADTRSRASAVGTAAVARASEVIAALTAARAELAALQVNANVEPLPSMRERLTRARAIRDQQLTAKAAHEEAQRRIDTLTVDVDGKVRERSRYGQPRARAVIQAAADVESTAAAQLPALEREVESARATAASALEAHAAFVDAPAALARAEVVAKEVTDRRERLLRQGAFVEQVPCKGGRIPIEDPIILNRFIDCSACPALVDAREARTAAFEARAEASQAAALLSEATRRKALHDESAERVKATATAFAQAQSRLSEVQAAKTRLDGLLVESERLEHAERADAALTQARAALAAATAESAAVVETGRRLRMELAAALRVEPAHASPAAIEALEREIEARATAVVDGGASQVAALQVRIADLERQEESARQEVDAGRVAHVAAVAAHAAAAAHADAARQAAAAAAAEVTAARVDVARLKGGREPLARDVAALPALEAALVDARLELEDYTLIETGFGPRGVPGLIIDAEGGRLAEDMQECLDIVYGERAWEVEFRTYDEAAAKREALTKVEIADLFVRGPNDAEWRNATDVSGGEGKMLDQAFRGALRRMVSRRTGRVFSEVIHDERDTGLDLAKQREYVPMVRATGPARHLIVSHNAQVQAACDHRVYLSKEGGVSWA